MKTIVLILISVSFSFLTNAQNKELIGTWNIIECAYVSSSGTEKIMEQEIKNGTAVTDYFIMEKGKYKMTSNMSGSGTMDTYEGEWRTSDNKLVMTITVNNQTMDIEWKYELKDNKLFLSRENPMGTLTIVNTYLKK